MLKNTAFLLECAMHDEVLSLNWDDFLKKLV